MKQIVATTMNCPTELVNKASDIHINPEWDTIKWNPRTDAQNMRLYWQAQFIGQTNKIGRKLQPKKLWQVVWMGEIGKQLVADGLVEKLNDRFVMEEDEWNARI